MFIIIKLIVQMLQMLQIQHHHIIITIPHTQPTLVLIIM